MRSLLSIIVAAAAIAGHALEAAGQQAGGECPATAQELRAPTDCICPPPATAGAMVWGTDVYTDDSSICLAAVHAGAIGRAGGPVRVLATRGRQSYAGSTRNGVASQAYGRWPNAFSFAE